MKRMWFAGAAAIVAALFISAARGAEPAKSGEEEGRHGTAVNFVDSPSEAARLALKQEKLVMVLHISGIFEDPGCT
jgi:hypothetical protein